MNKLVEIRVNDAIGSITLIEHALNRAKKRRSEADALSESVKAVLNPSGIMNDIATLIHQCQFATDLTPRELPPELVINNAAEARAKLEKQLKQILSLSGKLKAYRFGPTDWTKHADKSTTILNLKRRLLTDIQTGLTPQAPSQLLQEFEKARPFWGEHLETVAGIVLRDEGYDDGLSILADAIVKLCSDLDMPSPTDRVGDTLNVLGRDQTVLKDLDHTIYFRFPAWSIWGLPLMAHDVWHASEQGSVKFQERLAPIFKQFDIGPEREQILWNDALVQDCLADTFATRLVGPAYAFACILLLLNVASPRDQVRAEIILTTLEGLLPFGSDKDSVAVQLRNTWDEARGKGADDRSPHLGCLLQLDCHAVGSLLNSYWASVQRRAEFPADAGGNLPTLPSESTEVDSAGTCRLVWSHCELAAPNGACPMANTRLIRALSRELITLIPLGRSYKEDTWITVGTTLDGYLKRELPMENGSPAGQIDPLPKLPEIADIRYVLYAAWFTRWKLSERQTEEISKIGRNAVHLCRVLILKPRGKDLRGDTHGSYYDENRMSLR